MRVTASLLSSAVLGALLWAAPVAAAATGETVAALPVTTLYDLEVDAAHGHVYVTGETYAGLYVRTMAGAEVASPYTNAGARGMSLSADGSTLYLALYYSNAIVAVDTTTLAETGRWSTGAGTCPHDVAEIGTQLWFAYGCTNMGDIGVVERAGETPTVTLDRVSMLLAPSTSRLLAASGSRLLVHDDAYNKIYVLTAADGALTETAVRQFGDEVTDFTLSPDGTQVLVSAYGNDPTHGAYAVADLTTVRGYGSALYASGIAAANGYVVTGVDLSSQKELTVWKADGTLVRTYDLAPCCTDPSVPPLLVRGSTRFTADGSTLYAVTQSGDGNPLYLHAFAGPTRGVATITLTKPASAKIRVAYAFTGRIASELTLDGPQTVHVARVSTAYGTVPLPDVTTAADGSFSFSDTVRRRATYTYKVTWDGDAEHAPALGQASVKVLGLTPSLSVATSASTYRWNATAAVKAHLGATYTNRTVQITATPYGQAKKTLRTGAVDGDGYLRTSLAVSRRTVFAAVFAGDAVYEPRTVTKTVTVGVNIKQILGDYYATSGSYKVYRRTVDPTLHAEVSPNRSGTCMAFAAQSYTSGAWRTVATESCIPLDFYSITAVQLSGSHPVGVNYRMRSTFAGDASNAKTYGAWVYFRFTT